MNHRNALAAITESYYSREWERWPSSGSRSGLVEYDDRFEVPAEELIADQIADLSATRRQVEALPEPTSGTLAALDRQALLAHIEQ